jgi:hypothetical protein
MTSCLGRERQRRQGELAEGEKRARLVEKQGNCLDGHMASEDVKLVHSCTDQLVFTLLHMEQDARPVCKGAVVAGSKGAPR